MGLNDVISGERPHISFFGLRNAGKSSLVNAFTGQQLSIVSDVKGTTTDPVQKSMELLPLGPVVIIDTPGIDDEGALGQNRVERAYRMLDKTDIAILVVDGLKGLQTEDKKIIDTFKNKNLPYIVAYNKCDLFDYSKNQNINPNEIFVSAEKGININSLKERVANIIKSSPEKRTLLNDIVSSHDVVVLCTPIDESAPKGRLILPQQQTIRALLDIGATVVVSRETELKQTLQSLKQKPSLVITDSKVFEIANKLTPQDVLLTSFSVLFARYKGNLLQVVKGASKLNNLNDGDIVLIAEGCTHHRQCNDIGSVKLPTWLKNYTNKNLNFEFTSGGEFPSDLKKYALVIHCGACMLNEKEMQHRQDVALKNNVAITNYGIAIAQMHHILKRSLLPFPELTTILPTL